MYIDAGHVVRALTIAGSDSGGGAGVQADLKTMHQFQVYGTSVITAVTAQNTLGVQGIAELDPAFVRQELQSVMQDIGADAIKTGMLSSAEIIHEVAAFLAEVRPPYLVVDPVMVAKGGASLLKRHAIAAMRDDLLPLAAIVTPNIPEAEELCGYTLDSFTSCKRAAVDIAAMGPQIVVIKGGHMMQQDAENGITQGMAKWAIDVVFDKESGFTALATPRIATVKSHGTGCTFSSAITSMLARGASPLQAIATAKAFVHEALVQAATWDIGAGHGPTDHSAKITLAQADMKQGSYLLSNGKWIPWEDSII